MTKAIIHTENLNIGYGNVTVINHADFKVYPGEIFTILGGSGCGKTTLMSTLIGLNPAISGKIFINGIEATNASHEDRKRITQCFGVMFQSGALISSLTILENVMLPIQEHSNLPDRIIRECALSKLELVNLKKHAHFYPSEISGGMVKRAAIARAMARDPKIIFLDEPSAGLDPVTRFDLDELITKLAKTLGITFVMVTHELATINSIADRGIILNNNTVVAEGTIEELKALKNDSFVNEFFHIDQQQGQTSS